jgi:hypothetical protein
VDDAAAEVFAQFQQLEALEIPETSMTFAGLTQLASKAPPGLKHLFIGGLEMTPEQLEQFRRMMPNCQVSWWQKPTIEYPESGRRFGN